MSFIYPRVIAISRPTPTTGIGALPYQALSSSSETMLFTNIAASIQHRGSNVLKAGLPADANTGNQWNILFNLPNGSVWERDVITDEFGKRYQVNTAYWNSLGYQCECERLQT